MLGGKYRFDPEDDRALGIWDTRENQRITDNIALGIQMFLGIIGALTLFVGGMGVANIMYAVVKERTREIGVKMALGAKVRQVMAPFVLEALLMTVIGGVLGTSSPLALMAGIAALPLKGEAFELLGRPTFSPAIALGHHRRSWARSAAWPATSPARRAASVNPRESPCATSERLMVLPMRAAMIRMQGIRKMYGTGRVDVEALRGVDLEVGANEYVAIVGPSGSGKSTLMNILGCLDTPSSGEYVLSGEAVARLDRNRLAEIRNKHIGFVFQNFNLLPYASALENVELPLLFGGVGPEGAPRARRGHARARALEDRMDHKPTELSGGQMQRVAIARALVNRPAILLADEPTGNLDSASGQAIVSLFDELHASGQTIVLITHDSGMAKLASRVVQIRDGQIVEDRRPRPSDHSARFRG